MALGASGNATLRLVPRETSLLFGVGPWDVPTFLAAAILLAAAALTAGFLPARSAMGIERSSALLRVF